MIDDPESDLRARYRAVLDHGLEPVTAAEARLRSSLDRPPGTAVRQGPPRNLGPARRLGAVAAVAALAAAVLVLVGTVVIVTARHPVASPSAEGLLTTTAGPCAGQPPGCGSADSSAAALSRGRWATFPSGPLRVRTGEVEVWTGKELIVWGGDSVAGVPLGDGAAYDPSTKTWRMLPASPLQPAGEAAAVWTGTEMVVLGGARAGGRTTAAVAAYVPATNSWRLLPSLPAGPLAAPSALWTGAQIVVVGGSASPNTFRAGLSDKAAVYSPSTGSWTSLPKLPAARPARRGWRLLDVAPVWTGTALDVFATWQRSGPCGRGCGYVNATSNAWAFPARASAWRELPRPPVELGGAVTAWTGRGAIVAGGSYCPWSCPPPVPLAALFSPSTRSWSRALGPGSVENWPGTWTGKAFVSLHLGGAGHPSGRNGQMLGAWAPSTGSWATLPSNTAISGGNYQPAGSRAVWTGTDLLVWGPRSFALVASARPQLSASLSLGSTTLRAGGTIAGTITVRNGTGKPIRLVGCGSIFQVLLASATYHPAAAWPTCATNIWIPVGASTYPVRVRAIYSECGQGSGLEPCTSGGLPPLPAGRYRATTFESPQVVPLPRPISVTVTG